MAAQPLKDVAINWPDRESGPWRVTVRFKRGEHWKPCGVAVELLDAGGDRVLRTSDLRGLRLPQVVGRAYEQLKQQLGREHDEALAAVESAAPEQRLERLEQLLRLRESEDALQAGRPRTAGRPQIARAELERVAAIYTKAYYAGQPPLKAVAKALDCDAKTAARRVAQCRRRGVLLSAQQGVPGGIPIAMRRGDADSLRGLIANERRRLKMRESLATAQGPGASGGGGESCGAS